MQVDKAPLPINTMDLQQPKVLVWPHQAEATKGKNAVIGEAKPDLRGKELVRKVEYEKTPDGKETFKVTVSASWHGGQGSSTPIDQRLSEPCLARPVRPVDVTGQTGVPSGRPRMIKPSHPEIGKRKLNVAKNRGSGPKPKVTFDMLFDKYSKQKAVTSYRSLKKGWGHLRTKEGHLHLQGLLQDLRVNHHSKGNALLHHGCHQDQMHYVRYTMTMEWCGCHTNKPFILDGVNKN
jgi:hypothetical protein